MAAELWLKGIKLQLKLSIRHVKHSGFVFVFHPSFSGSVLSSVPVGSCEAEEPDSPPTHQTLHRPPTPPRPLLPHRPQLQAQVHPEEGGNTSSLLHFIDIPLLTSDVFLQISSSAGRISVPRLSVGAVSSRPSTPTLGESLRFSGSGNTTSHFESKEKSLQGYGAVKGPKLRWSNSSLIQLLMSRHW